MSGEELLVGLDGMLMEVMLIGRELLVLTGFGLACALAWRYGRELLDALSTRG